MIFIWNDKSVNTTGFNQLIGQIKKLKFYYIAL